MIDSSSDSQNVPQSQISVSSREEVDRLAGELANSYASYFTIDVKDVKHKSKEALEECLAHLEEVCSVLDNYKQHDNVIEKFLEKLSAKNESLNTLYDQIDDLEQYIFETNRSLDELENVLNDLENTRKPGNKIKQVIDLLPKLSLSNMLSWSK